MKTHHSRHIDSLAFAHSGICLLMSERPVSITTGFDLSLFQTHLPLEPFPGFSCAILLLAIVLALSFSRYNPKAPISKHYRCKCAKKHQSVRLLQHSAHSVSLILRRVHAIAPRQIVRGRQCRGMVVVAVRSGCRASACRRSVDCRYRRPCRLQECRQSCLW